MAQVTTNSGVRITYDDKKERLIQRHITALLETFHGPDYGFMGIFQISQPLHVLGAMVRIADVNDEDTTRQLIFAAAVDLQHQPALSTAEFLERVGARAHEYLDRPFQEFHVLLPLNLAHENLNSIGSFSVSNILLTCSHWNDIQNAYAIEDLRNRIYHFLDLNTTPDLWNWSGMPLVANIHARTGQDAFQRASDAYDRLCAVINFILDTDRFGLARPRPKASIFQAAAYGVFRPDGALAEPFVSEENLSLQSHLATPRDLERVFRLLDEINAEQPMSYATSRFLNALMSFHNALGTTDWSKAYLSLWQALEILAFGSQQRYEMSQVADRISALVKGKEVLQDFLVLCADRRNDLVHRGQFSPDGQSEVVLLKSVVRQCLWRFFTLRKSYSTEEGLSEFYLHAAFSAEKLSDRKRVIETLLGQP